MKNAEIDALKKRVAKGELLTKAEQLQVLTILRRANRRIKDALNDIDAITRRERDQLTE